MGGSGRIREGPVGSWKTMIGDFASTHLYDGQVGRGVGQELLVLDVLVLYLMVFVVMISFLIEILFFSLKMYYFLKLFVIFY